MKQPVFHGFFFRSSIDSWLNTIKLPQLKWSTVRQKKSAGQMFVKTMMCPLKSKMFRAHIFLLKEEVWHFFTRSWKTKHYDSIICLMFFLCGENENPTLFVDWYDVSLSPEDPLRGYQTVEFWGSRRRMATRPFKCACYREPEVLCARRLQDETKSVEFWWTIPMIF